MKKELYDLYQKTNTSLEEIKSFIRDVNNSVDDRLDLFLQSYHLFPYASYLSECSITNRSSPNYDEAWSNTNHRSAIKIESILTCYLDTLFQELPDEIYEKYGDNVPVSILFEFSPHPDKKIIEGRILAILQDCISGVILDW